MQKSNGKIIFSQADGVLYFFATLLPVGNRFQEKCVAALFKKCKKLSKKDPDRALFDAVSLLPLTSKTTGQRDASVEDILGLAEKLAETNPQRACVGLGLISRARPVSRRLRKLVLDTNKKLWQKTPPLPLKPA